MSSPGVSEGLIALSVDLLFTALFYGVKKKLLLQVDQLKSATAVCDRMAARDVCRDGARYVRLNGVLALNPKSAVATVTDDPETVYEEVKTYEIGERFDNSTKKWNKERKVLFEKSLEKSCGIHRKVEGHFLRSEGIEFIALRSPRSAAHFSSLMTQIDCSRIPRKPTDEEKIYRVVEMGETTHAILTGSLLTIFAQLEFDGNELILREPSINIGPFVISKMCYENIIREYENNATIYNAICNVCVGLGVVIFGYTALRFIYNRNSGDRD